MDISITELDNYLKKSESNVSNIRPGCEKKILWSRESDTKTNKSIVFIHGFSASSIECSPVIELVAEKLKANLFLTRLRGHGQDGKALAEANLNELIKDTQEAIAIGKVIGDEVIVIGCSTGCSLIHLVLGQGIKIKSAIYISPNFSPKPLKGHALRLPGAKFLMPLVFGKTHSFIPKNKESARCWTTSYPISALFTIKDSVLAAHQVKHSKISTPMLFWFSDKDKIVNSKWTRKIASKIGDNVTLFNPILTNQDDPSKHGILGDILSPNQTKQGVEKILNWLDDN